ncbi:MAG: hypothetical protein ACOCRX_07215 [Candidatus Woesearchaeota archaeon]
MIKEYIFWKKNGKASIITGSEDFNWVRNNFSKYWKEPGEFIFRDGYRLIWDVYDKHFKTIIEENIILERPIKSPIKHLIYSSSWYSGGAASKIIKGKTPYWILTIIAKLNTCTREQVLDFIQDTYPTKHTQKNVKELLNAFHFSGLIDLNINDKYFLTVQGKKFYQGNVAERIYGKNC